MTASGFPFPYDVSNLLGGAVRVLYAPLSVTIPTRIEDVVSIVSPYAPATGWIDIGATKDQFNYDRTFTVDNWQVQQSTANIVEEVTDITRTITVSVAEFRKELLQIIENGPSIGAVAASAGHSAQDRIGFGQFASIARNRFAFVSRRDPSAGTVTEPITLKKRGRFFMGVGNECAIAAESLTMDQAKGAMTATAVKFTFYPDSAGTTAEGEEHGAWYDEHAGVIA